ncbi:hypothetical protein ARMGADRAFT_1037800 [Armillaria gallica]|uniref:Uncharacterized protein n=1 Tax=Armillaria gallica TaxID=47427 RepID=A0A2H3CKS4_ARMGA|nr:hypothetical protein ARMGADRAFT_1037800 [Armillaria gallica]
MNFFPSDGLKSMETGQWVFCRYLDGFKEALLVAMVSSSPEASKNEIFIEREIQNDTAKAHAQQVFSLVTFLCGIYLYFVKTLFRGVAIFVFQMEHYIDAALHYLIMSLHEMIPLYGKTVTSDQPFFVLQRNNVIYGKIVVPLLSLIAIRAMEGKANSTGSGITTMTRTIRTIPIIRTTPAVEVKVIPSMLKAGENEVVVKIAVLVKLSDHTKDDKVSHAIIQQVLCTVLKGPHELEQLVVDVEVISVKNRGGSGGVTMTTRG